MTKVLFGIGFDMLSSELYKIMVNKVTFLDFRVGDRPHLNPSLFRSSIGSKNALFWLQCFFFTHASFRHVTSLGHQGVRRVFREGPKFFELCSMVLNFVQHIFPGEAKIFQGPSPPCTPNYCPGFFTHGINQGWANLFNGRVACRKPKTPASRKASLQCQYKY